MATFREVLKRDLNIYLETNSQYIRLHQELQEIKEVRTGMEQNILDYLKENNQQSNVFVMNDVKIQQKTQTIYQTLSMKFLESCLKDYNDHATKHLQVDDILNFIKNKRDKRQKDELKVTNA
jgi:hypothetical protein